MSTERKPPITWADFEKIDFRVGTVVDCKPFPEARRPAYQLQVDFGEPLGTLKSSAQLTHFYQPEDLLGKQVLCVVNFPEKQIGKFMSQCLVTGFYHPNGGVVLCSPERTLPNGSLLG